MEEKYLSEKKKYILNHVAEENAKKLALKEYRKECLEAMICPECGTKLIKKPSDHPQVIGLWKFCEKCGKGK